MMALLIVAIVAVLLLFMSCIRVGGQVQYGQEGFRVWLKVGPLRILLFPKEAGEKKRKQKKPKEQSLLKGSLKEFRALLPSLIEAVQHLKEKIRVDHLFLKLTVAASDPAHTAFAYGSANAILGMIWPPIEHNFSIKDYQIRTQADFEKTETEVQVDAAFSMMIRQWLYFAVKYGLGTLLQYRALQKKKTEQREADSYGKKPSHS